MLEREGVCNEHGNENERHCNIYTTQTLTGSAKLCERMCLRITVSFRHRIIKIEVRRLLNIYLCICMWRSLASGDYVHL